MLKGLYTFRDEDHVSQFLRLNAFLIPVLEEIFDKAQQYFPAAPMELHILHTGEHEPSFLVASVRLAISARDAFATMKRFRHEWWFGQMDRAREKLLITVNF